MKSDLFPLFSSADCPSGSLRFAFIFIICRRKADGVVSSMAPVDHPRVPLKRTPARGKANSVVGINWEVGMFHSGGGKCGIDLCERKIKWRRWRGSRLWVCSLFHRKCGKIFRAAPQSAAAAAAEMWNRVTYGW